MQIKNVRFIIAAITTFSAYAVYVSRVNLSIAIIAMVDDGHLQHASSQGAQASAPAGQPAAAQQQLMASQQVNATTLAGRPAAQQQHQDTFSGMFPASKKSILKPPLISQEKFHWDQTEQGHILGAFFYGYILFQIPGARMAESVGARWILMAATAGSAIISLVFPLSTQLNSIHLLMVLRFVMGLCQSAFFPAAYVFFCRWLPEQERSVLLPIMFIGSNMGSISTYIMSSYLISSSYGWPSVFYVSGLICLLVTLLWFIFGSNGPQDNWLITSEECAYIMKNLNARAVGIDAADGDSSPSAAAAQRSAGARLSHLTTTTTTMIGNCCDAKNCKSNLCSANKCDRITTTASNKFLNKSKSANDLIPTSHTQHPMGAYQREQAALLEQGRGAKCNAPRLAATNSNSNSNSSNNNNNNNSARCCRHQVVEDFSGGGAGQAGQPDGQLCWWKLLGSLPIWVLILSMYGNEWSQVVLTYELPTYLNTALSFPIEQNGVINSFFQLSYTVASPILSSLGAYLLERHLMGMRKIHVRKLFQSLATFGQLACFVSVPICGANRGLIIMFMFSATVFKACANAGDIMVPGDLSPEYAGTIFAFANSIGNTAGFFVPLLAGFIVNNAYEREQWTPFWMTTATIMACSGLIFLIFGETRRQNFSVDDEPPPPPSATIVGCTGVTTATTMTTTMMMMAQKERPAGAGAAAAASAAAAQPLACDKKREGAKR